MTVTVTSDLDSGPGTLRAAITSIESHFTTALSTINFDITVGVPTISLVSPLPALSQPIKIDGTTQPGYSTTTHIPVIVLDGSGATGANGLTIAPGGSTSVIQGLSIVGFSSSTSFPTTGGDGIFLSGTTGGDTISGNYIGILPNGTKKANATGIGLDVASSSNTIGGAAGGLGNVISGNGIGIAGTAMSCLIEGNYIGLGGNGTTAIGNGEGIQLDSAVSTTIGGTTTATRNVIASSGGLSIGAGIDIDAGYSDLIEGNYVGLTAGGVVGAGTANTEGMRLFNDSSTIGGVTAGSGNTIGGNSDDGLYLLGTGDAIYGNVIGEDATGAKAGNGGDGVLVNALSSGSPVVPFPENDSIGGTAAGQGNIIANNTMSGVAGIHIDAMHPAISGLGIRGNQIFNNGFLGIDISPTVLDGPSKLYINSATLSGGTVTISGNDFGLPSTTYSVDLFAINGTPKLPYGQGPSYLGTVTMTTNNAGFGYFSKSIASSTLANAYTATATGSDGNTSGFSENFMPKVATTSATDLQVTSAALSKTVSAGSTVTLVETIKNNGPAIAPNVVFYDSLPTSLTAPVTLLGSLTQPLVVTSVGQSYLYSNGVLAATLGNLAPGASVTVTIVGIASTAGVMTDQPGVSSDTFDTNFANNQAAPTTISVAPDTATPPADLVVIQGASKTSGLVGYPMTYTITVANLSTTQAATDVIVSDLLPAGVGIAAPVGSPGLVPLVDGSLVTANLGTIAPLSIRTLTFVLTPFVAGTIVNTATVSGDQYDPDSANNATSLATPVSASPPTINLYLAESANTSVGTTGVIQLFTFTVENFGPDPATNVTLGDSIPAGSIYYIAYASQGAAPTMFSGSLIDDFGTLAAGGIATLQFFVIPRTVGVLTNTAGVYSPDGPTSMASVTSSVASAAELIIVAPAVSSLIGIGSNRALAVTFDEAMDPTSSTRASNYLLVSKGKNGQGVAQTISIAAITYNPANDTVSILPSQPLDPTLYYTLTIFGSTASGVLDAQGRHLASSVFGAAGGNFTVTFFAGTLPQL